MSNPIGVVGSDGFTPLYDQNARWTIWRLSEIFTGGIGQNKYIPKLNDYVVEPETGALYRVAELSDVTFIPVLVPISFSEESGISQLLMKTNSEAYRVYYDDSVDPPTLQVDGTFKLFNTDAMTARLFEGGNVSNDTLISRRYDNSKNYLGPDIPLREVRYDSHDITGVKFIPACNTTRKDLVNGSTVTLVTYAANGAVVSRHTLVLEATNFISQAFSSQRYIANISIKSAFINPSNDNEIHYPINLPFTSFSPIGVVHYSDGTSAEYPIDGNKFSLYGIDPFMPSILGQSVNVLLKYHLGADELALSTNRSFVSRSYRLIVSNAGTSYNVKLYAYPVWGGDALGWKLRYFLINLNRDTVFDVTPYAHLSPTSAPFSPKLYGITQRLGLSIDLSNIPGYGSYLYNQLVEVTLRAPANTLTANLWEVSQHVPTNGLVYGTNLLATQHAIRTREVKVNNGMTLSTFLTKVYANALPIIDTITEDVPFEPTHLRVFSGAMTNAVTKPIADFDKTFQLPTPPAQYDPVFIIFLKEIPSTTEGLTDLLTLGISAMTLRGTHDV